jgi:hypothetical protein
MRKHRMNFRCFCLQDLQFKRKGRKVYRKRKFGVAKGRKVCIADTVPPCEL